MDRPEWSEVKELFRAIVEMDPEKRREALGSAPPDIRAEVEALLEAHDQAEASVREGDAAAEGPGTVIGRYKLLQEIGAGGFGVVYMAEQKEPVRRRVALKIIRRGMDTDQVVRRFEAERQALALMEHPHIAKVLDGGATERGRPYFVMELVKGIPITEYCDKAKLTTVERLELFTQICHAVQHAHQKGIIHRDLKPGNVLVTLHDGVPVPKIIDFGVAKATERHLTQKTLFTEFRQIVGTPEYMAPEQAEMSGLDVDTRADIYSLGVMLYELLTGTKPFDMSALLDRGYDEVLRTIREVDPPKPSTRISTMGDEVRVVARKRHTPPKLLGRLIRGDLDWIVMKALEKDRSRRYDTASALSADIERHLTDQPVLAGPPSGAYRLRKYVRRHRIGVLASSAVILALVAGLIAATIGLTRARQAEAEAAKQRDAARTAAEREAEQRTRAEAGEARAKRGEAQATTTLDLLLGMLTAANPFETADPNLTVRKLLDGMRDRLAAEPPGDPEVEARVRVALGSSYSSLGLLDEAKPHLASALKIRRETLGGDHVETARVRAYWAQHLRARAQYEESLAEASRALSILQRELGREHGEAVACLLCRSLCLIELVRLQEAETAAQQALDICSARGDANDPQLADCLEALSNVRETRGDARGAAEIQLRALAAANRVHGEGHPRTLGPRLEALRLQYHVAPLDQIRGIEAEMQEALATTRRVLGKDHPFVATALHNLSGVYCDSGRYDLAEQSTREALDITRRAYGNKHPRAYSELVALAEQLATRGEPAAADLATREALALGRELFREGHPYLVQAILWRAAALARLGPGAEPMELLTEALAAARGKGKRPHVETSNILLHLGWRLTLTNPEEAEHYLEEGLAIRRAVYGDQSYPLFVFLDALASVKHQRMQLDAAIELRREAYELTQRTFGDRHAKTIIAKANLGGMLGFAERGREAERLLREAVEEAEAAFGGEHRVSIAARSYLADLLSRRGDCPAAEEHQRIVLRFSREHNGPKDVNTYNAISKLAVTLSNQNKPREAERLWREELELAREMFGEQHWRTSKVLLALSDTLGREDGEKAVNEVLERLTSREGQAGFYRAEALIRAARYLRWRGEYGGAEARCREAAGILAEVFGDSHSHVGWALLELARTRAGQLDPAGAEELAGRALRLATKGHGERCIGAACAHGFLGALSVWQENEQDAKYHLGRGIELFAELQVVTPDRPDLACDRLGRLLHGAAIGLEEDRAFAAAVDVLNDSEKLFRKARELSARTELRADLQAQRNLARSTRSLAHVLGRRGGCNERLANFEAALPDFRAAAKLGRELFGPDHEQTLIFEIHLGACLLKLGEAAAAEALARENLPRARKLWSPASASGYLALLGESLLKQERWAEAEGVLRECLSVCEKHAPDSDRVYDAMCLLGDCLVGQKRFTEAEPLLLKGHAGWEGLKDKDNYPKSRREALQSLVDLYEKWGKPEKAAEWRAKAVPESRQ